VDGHGAAQVSAFSPALVALPRGQALVAWQDMARGPGQIRIARVRRGRAAGRARRVDEAHNGSWSAWRPALALTRGRVVCAWEDERDGPAQIYVASARTSRIR
jgi:hypothetical protein